MKLPHMSAQYRRLVAPSILVIAILSCLNSSADARHRRAAPVEPGRFDYYLLALSWSPTYCLVHPNDRSECTHRGYGFVLHGLWPQFDSGGYPENCVPESSLSPAAEAVGRTVYPSPRLMQHEWQRHGTCSGLDAVDYFRTADRALAAVRIPSSLSAPSVTVSMTSMQIITEFRAANSGMPDNALRLACSRGELSEIRVCLSRDLQLRSCGRRVRNSCPLASFEIPASR